MKRIACALLFVLVGASAGPIGAQDSGAYKVIVNPANPMTQMSRLKLGEIFLKKDKRWPDGQPVVPVEPSTKAATRQRFTQEIFGKTTMAVSAYWQQMIFSGKGIPPAEKATDLEVVAFVRDTPGSIGYVGSGADLSGVKILAIVD
jgi:ABC-type phosphate transport system substrate-binding protein